jgi:hypothetical protein
VKGQQRGSRRKDFMPRQVLLLLSRIARRMARPPSLKSSKCRVRSAPRCAQGWTRQEEEREG